MHTLRKMKEKFDVNHMKFNLCFTGKKKKKQKFIDKEAGSSSGRSSGSSGMSVISTEHLKETREMLKANIHQDSTKKNYHCVWRNLNKFIIRLDEIPESWEERTSLYCTYLIENSGIQSSTLKSFFFCFWQLYGYLHRLLFQFLFVHIAIYSRIMTYAFSFIVT